jgi:hypothetical protein
MATRIGRRLFVPLLASGLLLAANAGSAFAKCEGPNPPDFCSQVVAQLSVLTTTGTFQAGTETAVDISVSRGEQPYQAQKVWLAFTRWADDSTVNAFATATTQPGLWRANVTLPSDGSWTVVANVVDAQGAAVRQSLEAVQVAAPQAEPPAQPPVTTPTPPAPPSVPLLPIGLVLAALAAAGAAAVGLRQRTRQGPAGELAPASRSERSG